MRRLALVLTVLACFLWSAPALGDIWWLGSQMTWEARGTLQCEDVNPEDGRYSDGEISGDGLANSETYQVYDSTGALAGTMSCGDGYHGLLHVCEVELVEVPAGAEEGCAIVEISGDVKGLRCWVSPVGFSTGLVVMTFHGYVIERPVRALLNNGAGPILARCTEGGGVASFEIPISVVRD